MAAMVPAPWIDSAEVEERLTANGVDLDTLPSYADAAALAQAATDELYARTGRQWNINTWTVRPQRVRLGCTCWMNTYPGPMGYASYYCGCGEDELRLAPTPVSRIVEVVEDGVTLTAGTDYVLYDDSRLVRLGHRLWRCCQSLDEAITEVGTWQVVYVAGDLPPMLGTLAAGELALQFGLQLSGSGACTLPPGTVNVSRQGLTINLDETGMTGIVGDFLATFPAHRSSFTSPERMRLRRSS